MSTVIDSLERSQLRRVPAFDAGDRLRVHFQVIEGTRRRTQVFEGVVIKRQGHGARETFTVRKQSFGVGVERTFPLHSPKIERIEVAARVAERRWGIDDDIVGKKAKAAAESTAVDAEGVSQEEVVPTEAEAAAAETTETEEATATDQGPVDETPNEAEASTDEPEDEEPAKAGDSDEDSAG